MHEAAEDVKNAVLAQSKPIETDRHVARGDLSWMQHKEPVKSFVNSFTDLGFQATHLGRAINEINRMVNWKPTKEDIRNNVDPNSKCTIWLSFTSNLMSSGLREYFVYLAKNKKIDIIVTSAGGVEEDFVKCMASTYLGEFKYSGVELREKGWNRVGNLIVPNQNYCDFETWLQPLLDECLTEQIQNNIIWTPSKLIHKLGLAINDESSLYYWCAKNGIPVFCPGLTDGSLGDNLFFHSYRNPGLIIDVVQDIKRINDLAIKATQCGTIILGGGIAKHHTLNANLMRNGAEYAVYINTAQEYDGSDSGAEPNEALSWGKIKASANPVKVNSTLYQICTEVEKSLVPPIENSVTRIIRIFKLGLFPFHADSEWTQADAIQLIQWLKEFLAIFAGIFCGLLGLKGYVGFFTGLALVFGLCYLYLKMSFIPDDVLDESEAIKEGLTPSVMTFILIWTLVHTLKTQKTWSK